MKNLKSQQIARKSAINTPNNQSGYGTRKNTQTASTGFTKEDVSPQKRTSQNSQGQFSQQAQAINQNEQQQGQQQQYQGNSNANSRIEYSNIDQSDANQIKNGRISDYPRSQTNIDNYEIQQQQKQRNMFSQQNSIPSDQKRKTLRTMKSESMLYDAAQRNLANIEFNYSFVDNLISKRGFASEKMVPMELFQEIMQYFEKRFIGVEQRIEDNEQLAHLSDRLLELRNFNPNVQKIKRYNQSISSQYQQKQMSQSVFTYGEQSTWNRGHASLDFTPYSFESEQAQRYTSSTGFGVYSAPAKQTESRLELLGLNSDQNHQIGYNENIRNQIGFHGSFNNQVDSINNNQNNNIKFIQNGNENLIDLNGKITSVESRISQFDDFTKTLTQDIEKKFTEYGKKLNIQIEKFFKNASQKMEQYGEKDQKLQNIQDSIQKQLDILNQTYILKQEEFVINKEEINDSIKTISALVSKLENRLNEHSIDIQESKTLIKGIEDDLFVMLKNYKELSEGVQNYRNLSDDIGQLKQNQANILKSISINAIYY